jgi:hypothetical protein
MGQAKCQALNSPTSGQARPVPSRRDAAHATSRSIGYGSLRGKRVDRPAGLIPIL